MKVTRYRSNLHWGVLLIIVASAANWFRETDDVGVTERIGLVAFAAAFVGFLILWACKTVIVTEGEKTSVTLIDFAGLRRQTIPFDRLTIICERHARGIRSINLHWGERMARIYMGACRHFEQLEQQLQRMLDERHQRWAENRFKVPSTHPKGN